MNVILLLIVALTPGFILMYLILYMDRNEKEPMGLVVKATLLGVLSCIPAIIIETLLSGVPLFHLPGIAGAFFASFIQIAPAEEISKLSVILLFIWKNKNFNEENDGIVYVGASALGFAMFENIFYVMSNGFGTGIVRTISAMPLHCFTGVLMGYFVGLAKFAADSKKRRSLIITGLLIAIVIHGLYDTFALSKGDAIIFLIFPIIIGLVIFGIIYMKKGRALSVSRWKDNPAVDGNQNSTASIDANGESEPAVEVSADSNAVQKSNSSSGLWKAVLGRFLFGISFLFWALLIIGFFSGNGEYRLSDLIAGGAILTFVPVLIGLLLEISYQRQKK